MDDYFFESIKIETKYTNGWEFYSEDEGTGFNTYTKKISNIPNLSSNISFKIQNVKINYPIRTVWNTIKNVEYRNQWSNFKHNNKASTKNSKFIEKKENSDIIYVETSIKSMIVTDRDYVVERRWMISNDEIYMCSSSIEHKDVPEIKGIVRCNILAQSVYLKKTSDNDCEITFLSWYKTKTKIVLTQKDIFF
jgi:hypothetical protein